MFVPGAIRSRIRPGAWRRPAGATLVVDQFEEAFAVGVAPDVLRSFCAPIADRLDDGTPVIVVIRADHITGLVEDPLGSMARQRLHFVTPLTGDELKAAIEQPAELAGLRLEHGLVELLLRDAEGEPGALPLLSYTLMETWRRRDGNVLTVDGYRESGGIRGAVARSADRLYDSLPSEQRTVLRSLMLRLVAPSIEGDPVRCRVSRTTLRGDAGRERIVDLLVRARLLTAEEGTVEIAHESLARAWPRLRTWLEDDTEGQRILRHLAAGAAGWDSLGRPDSELYRGARLDTAVEYRAAAAGSHVRRDGVHRRVAPSAGRRASDARGTGPARRPHQAFAAFAPGDDGTPARVGDRRRPCRGA